MGNSSRQCRNVLHSLRTDCNAFYTLVPQIVAFILLLAGLILLLNEDFGIGFVVLGFGFLGLGGFGGAGLPAMQIKITAPLGLVCVVFGLIYMFLVG